jgi:hypothetical protein
MPMPPPLLLLRAPKHKKTLIAITTPFVCLCLHTYDALDGTYIEEKRSFLHGKRTVKAKGRCCVFKNIFAEKKLEKKNWPLRLEVLLFYAKK